MGSFSMVHHYANRHKPVLAAMGLKFPVDSLNRCFYRLYAPFHWSLSQVATAIRGAIIQAKMGIVPVRRGYWGNKIGDPHTVPTKVSASCGSVHVRLIPAPRGAGIVAARTPKKVLQMAGILDCYTCSRGSTKTLGNFVKATFTALSKTYGFLTPDMWRETRYAMGPYQEYTDFLAKPMVAEPKMEY